MHSPDVAGLEHVVVAVNLTQQFILNKNKTVALDQLSLTMKVGKITALVGPDGAGKTTFLRLIAGLYTATSGQLEVLGINVKQDPQAVQNLISYMPQKFGLYEDLTVLENLQLYADLHAVAADIRPARFAKLLNMTDLTQFTDRPAGQLSGGMKQKLGLACTLVRSPQLLLLDEPSAGVDPLSRRDLWDIIQQLVKEEQLSVIISTSYMDEAERCAAVFILYQGKILAQGMPEQLQQHAQGCTWDVQPPSGMKSRHMQARLLANKNLIADAVPKGDRVRFITQRPYDTLPAQRIFENAIVEKRPATLEDAFMLLLHQVQLTTHDDAVVDFAFETAFEEIAPEADASSQILNTDAAPVIVVRDLVRKFGDFTAVADTSFEVKKGEVFGLLGPNGAGKTTTFRMLCGLLPASSGFLQVAGLNLRDARAQARARIGYVSQKFALYGNLSVQENLHFFGGAYGLYGKQLKARIALMLQQFDLEPKVKSADLPGGYKQRLSMAVALIHQPEIIFLDEPTSGIDPLARRSFWYSIGALANQGISIIITTHFMEEAKYCDRIAIQDAGKLLALGTPQQVREQAGLAYASDMNSAFIAIVESARTKTCNETQSPDQVSI